MNGLGNRMKKPFHLGIGHFWTSTRDGVNLDHLYNVSRIDGQDFYSIGYRDKEDIGLERGLQKS